MTRPTAVILVVGLNQSLIGPHTPRLQTFANSGTVYPLQPVLPAVTSSVQASMLTGLTPGPSPSNENHPPGHGIVGNGWFDRESAEIRFWKQSNRLVHGEKVWETARKRDPQLTCANLFWWFNMYSSVDFSVTPRPIYKADGRKIPDIYTEPPQLRDQLQEQLGRFPLFHFWGPASSIISSQWIADASQLVHDQYNPTLTLIYLPHLDYGLQKLGPNHPDIPSHLAAIDNVVGQLLDDFEQRGVRVMVVSEYGIEPVSHTILINRELRLAGAVRVREEQGLELLDPGASEAFAVADHQIAHVYVKHPRQVAYYHQVCRRLTGVQQVLDRKQQEHYGLAHPRAGDLVLLADRGSWFSYDYWLDDAAAPDFARTVEIHRKPGYDPRELFINPAIRLPRLYVARKLLMRKFGQRALLDVIPLDASLVRGSHGRVDLDDDTAPILITQQKLLSPAAPIPCYAIRDIILDHLFEA